MSIYAIGDVQGCAAELEALLKKISYSETQDDLWFCGDLINRGPDSLAVMRIIMSLPRVKVVLGNHDIYLIALSRGVQTSVTHTLDNILNASDSVDIVQWLLQQSFLVNEFNIVMVHAGIPPQWDLAQSKLQATKLIDYLRQDLSAEKMQQLFGRKPDEWSPQLSEIDDLRYTLNAFTRMRFCTAEGKLDFTKEGVREDAPAGFKPWFEWSNRKTRNEKIIFGHWAALEGKTGVANVIATDTGCVWGRELTAYRLEDGKRFSVRFQLPLSP